MNLLFAGSTPVMYPYLVKKIEIMKYLGPKVKVIRKLGQLPGLTQKIIKNRIKTPGQHGILVNRIKQSSLSDDYKHRLLEKQKLKFNYCITEKQLKNYYKKAKQKKGSTGLFLLTFLESRLDCIIYRLGFAPTIIAARQLINHRHILVNNKIVTIASYMCKLNDIINIKKNSSLKLTIYKKIDLQSLIVDDQNTSPKDNILPSYLDLNLKTYTGKVISFITCDTPLIRINELKVIEYYSR